jgi:carbamoyltransferase
MKTIWGISALNHDASITVVRDNEILFAGHAERYSRIKNDYKLNGALIFEASKFGSPDQIVWFEKPYAKKLRQAYAGQWDEVWSQTPKSYLKEMSLGGIPVEYVPHHMSHAAAGYYTSPFNDATVIVVDAIGEWDTISVWEADGNSMRKVHSVQYPNSLGLLYSAMTQRIGLKPNEEEYILMGMAAYGQPSFYADIMYDFVEEMDGPNLLLKENLHRGIKGWKEGFDTEHDYMNMAASVQRIAEDFMIGIAIWANKNCKSKNLVLMGGVALNCVANEQIAKLNLFKDIWIMPNPGDAGSSLGCIAAYQQQKLNWKGPYLGTNISREFSIPKVLNGIIEHKIIGVATGRAEFGPRALGNRSLIADPRGNSIKSKVNNIKKRQQFRPFAPIVLEQFAHEYFDLPVATSPYMQFTAPCKRPDLFPAICHVDGSSRVQTLNKDQNPVIYELLEGFYNETGCPMLLNTSLNIKGEPLVDTWEDAIRFRKKHNVPMF